jgi:hypothetical protein
LLLLLGLKFGYSLLQLTVCRLLGHADSLELLKTIIPR